MSKMKGFCMVSASFEQVIGRDSSYIDFESLERPVHCELVPEFLSLKSAARGAGFDLRIASGFRDFERQLTIWNQKAEGKRPLLDAQGRELEYTALPPDQVLSSILRWSALPGASRHHWGSDIDIYDAAAVDDGYVVQLTGAECESGGPFAPFHCWLTEYLAGQSAFFRPYDSDMGGVSPEPWHLSYRPLAQKYGLAMDARALYAVLESVNLGLRDLVLARFDEIFQRYVLNLGSLKR